MPLATFSVGFDLSLEPLLTAGLAAAGLFADVFSTEESESFFDLDAEEALGVALEDSLSALDSFADLVAGGSATFDADLDGLEDKDALVGDFCEEESFDRDDEMPAVASLNEVLGEVSTLASRIF